MKFLLAQKEGMTQIFGGDGIVHPVTVLSVSPNVVTQVKTAEKDTYSAVQVGAGAKSKKNITKPVLGHLKNLGPFRTLREFRVSETEQKVGDTLDASVFAEGDVVSVSALSKGKGFQGVVKRHNFSGGRRSHGNKHAEREGGSIGAKGVARVWKGTKMPGRTGGNRVTVKNLTIVSVDQDAQKLYVSGAVPGRRGTVVEVRGA